MRTTCTVAQCDRSPHFRGGMCQKHANRAAKGMPLEGDLTWWRFDQRIQAGENGCWDWRGTLQSEGYGLFNRRYAHRLSYERHVGPIPQGMHIDHLCRNRRCVNPDHLEPVTQGENTRRGQSPWALDRQRGACKRGHEITPANRYRRPDGYTECLPCIRLRTRGLAS